MQEGSEESSDRQIKSALVHIMYIDLITNWLENPLKSFPSTRCQLRLCSSVSERKSKHRGSENTTNLAAFYISLVVTWELPLHHYLDVQLVGKNVFGKMENTRWKQKKNLFVALKKVISRELCQES